MPQISIVKKTHGIAGGQKGGQYRRRSEEKPYWPTRPTTSKLDTNNIDSDDDDDEDIQETHLQEQDSNSLDFNFGEATTRGTSKMIRTVTSSPAKKKPAPSPTTKAKSIANQGRGGGRRSSPGFKSATAQPLMAFRSRRKSNSNKRPALWEDIVDDKSNNNNNNPIEGDGIFARSSPTSASGALSLRLSASPSSSTKRGGGGGCGITSNTSNKKPRHTTPSPTDKGAAKAVNTRDEDGVTSITSYVNDKKLIAELRQRLSTKEEECNTLNVQLKESSRNHIQVKEDEIKSLHNKLEEVQQHANNTESNTRKSLKAKDDQTVTLNSKLQKQESKHKEVLQSKEKEIDGLESTIECLQKKVQDQQTTLLNERLEAKEQESSSLHQRVDTLSQRVTVLQTKLQKQEQASSNEERYQLKLDENKTLVLEINTLKQRLDQQTSANDEKLRLKQQEIAIMTRQNQYLIKKAPDMEALKRQCLEAEEELKIITKENQTLSNSLKEQESKNRQLQNDIEVRTKTYHQQVQQEHSNHQESIRAKDIELKSSSDRINTLQETIQRHQSGHQVTLFNLQRDINTWQNKTENLEIKLKGQVTLVATKERELATMTSKLQKVEKLLQKNEMDIRNKVDEIRALSQKVEILGTRLREEQDAYQRDLVKERRSIAAFGSKPECQQCHTYEPKIIKTLKKENRQLNQEYRYKLKVHEQEIQRLRLYVSAIQNAIQQKKKIKPVTSKSSSNKKRPPNSKQQRRQGRQSTAAIANHILKKKKKNNNKVVKATMTSAVAEPPGSPSVKQASTITLRKKSDISNLAMNPSSSDTKKKGPSRPRQKQSSPETNSRAALYLHNENHQKDNEKHQDPDIGSSSSDSTIF